MRIRTDTRAGADRLVAEVVLVLGHGVDTAHERAEECTEVVDGDNAALLGGLGDCSDVAFGRAGVSKVFLVGEVLMLHNKECVLT